MANPRHGGTAGGHASALKIQRLAAIVDCAGRSTAATGGADYAPAFSPNGQQIAFIRANWVQDSLAPGFRKPSVLALRIVNLDGSEDHQVLQLNQGMYAMRVSWSRDGTQLVFDSGNQLMVNGGPANVADQSDALWIVNTNGTGLHNVRSAFGALPVFSPSGTTFCNLGVTIMCKPVRFTHSRNRSGDVSTAHRFRLSKTSGRLRSGCLGGNACQRLGLQPRLAEVRLIN